MNKFNSNSSNKFGMIDKKQQFLNMIHQENNYQIEINNHIKEQVIDRIIEKPIIEETITDPIMIEHVTEETIIEETVFLQSNYNLERYAHIEQVNTTTCENDVIIEYQNIYQTKSDNSEIIYHDATEPKLKTVVNILANKHKLDKIISKKNWN